MCLERPWGLFGRIIVADMQDGITWVKRRMRAMQLAFMDTCILVKIIMHALTLANCYKYEI